MQQNLQLNADEQRQQESGILHWPGSSRRLDPVSGGCGSTPVPCNITDQLFSVPNTPSDISLI